MTIANYKSFREALAADFKATFTVAQSLPTQWENAPFDVPQDGPLWAKFDILTGREECAQIGPQNTWRAGGLLKVSIFFRPGQGIGVATAMADLVADRYRGGGLVGAVFEGVEKHEPRQDEGSADWWIIVVDCYFRVDRLA